MSSPDWMPFYVDDYLGDTGELSTVEHGAYLLLILHYWKHRGLPDSEQRLARIARVSESEWAGMRDALAEHFKDGWQHTRINAELDKADETIAKRKAAGVAGASARYGNRIPKPRGSDRQTHAPLPEPLPEKVATQPSGDVADRQRIEQQCREAAGLLNSDAHGLEDFSPIWTLIAAGYDLERDVLPKLRSAHAATKHGRTWAYYVPAIVEGKSANGKIPAKPPAEPTTPHRWILHESKDWPLASGSYRATHGKDPPRIAGLGGMGWHFPVTMLQQAETVQ